MRIEILCTGDEILTGKTVNTNYSHIAQRLGEVGLAAHWGTVVGDDRASLLQAFQQAAARANAVIVNGGLGPTVDDLSQEVAAQAAGVELALNEDWLLRIEGYYRRPLLPLQMDTKIKFTEEPGAMQKSIRPLGEWNSVEIVAKDGTVKSYQNGLLLNTITEHEFKAAGSIGFESEGSEIHWRNIRIKAE